MNMARKQLSVHKRNAIVCGRMGHTQCVHSHSRKTLMLPVWSRIKTGNFKGSDSPMCKSVLSKEGSCLCAKVFYQKRDLACVHKHANKKGILPACKTVKRRILPVCNSVLIKGGTLLAVHAKQLRWKSPTHPADGCLYSDEACQRASKSVATKARYVIICRLRVQMRATMSGNLRTQCMRRRRSVEGTLGHQTRRGDPRGRKKRTRTRRRKEIQSSKMRSVRIVVYILRMFGSCF